MVDSVSVYSDDVIENAMIQTAKRLGYTSLRSKQAESYQKFCKGKVRKIIIIISDESVASS